MTAGEARAFRTLTDAWEAEHKRAEQLEGAMRSIADYTQDGLNGECSLCYFKIEGLTTHKAECPWPAAVGAMRTNGFE